MNCCPENSKTQQQLLEKIEEKRQQMLSTSSIFGMTHEKTLKNSEELDELINKYYRKPPFA